MATQIGPQIGILGEKEFRASITAINGQLKSLGNEMKAVTAEFAGNESSMEALTAKSNVLRKSIEANENQMKVLSAQYDTQKSKLADLAAELERAKKEFGETSTEAAKAQNAYNRQATAVTKLENDINKSRTSMAQLKGELSNVESQMDGTADASHDLADGMENAGDAADRSGGKFSAATVAIGNLAANAISAAVSAIGDLVSSLWNLDEATEEYRIAQGRLNTAYEAAGFSADTAQQAYRGFYGILGDTDTATEASQLLAQLARNEQDVATWTDIAAGVSGTFGDSLPIEGLIEASNETAKVGEVTGVLADALNWVGISEDEFNEKLAACTSESERNDLIMNTLAGTYNEASQAFYANNAALVQSRDNQASLDATMAQLGTTIGNVKNQILSEFLPSTTQLASAFNGLMTGAPGASAAMQQAISSLITTLVAQLPGFINAGAQIIASLVSGLVQNLPQLASAAVEIVGNLVTMLAENLPDILEMGMDMLDQLVDGIIQAIPDLVAQLPQIITSITTFIAENLPQIIEAGVEIIVSLAAGLIQAIPQLVANLPQIIGAIASGLVNIAGNLLETGAQLLSKVWEGISGWIGNLTANMGQVIDGIKTGLKNGISKITDIGRDIIEGLWNGINDMASWIGEKIKGFGEGVLNGIKNFFGIASPSKVMRDEVGVMLTRGMAEGMTDGEKYVNRAAKKLGNAIEDEIARTNAQIAKMEREDAERQAAEELAAYQQSIKDKYAAAAEAEPAEKQKILDEIAQLEADWNTKQTEEARQAEKDKAEARLKELEDFQKEYEAGLAEIEKSQESMASKLSGYGELFSSTPDGLELGDLQSDIDQIYAYGDAIESLQARGISDSLMDEILGMNVDDAIAYTAKLLSMTDDEYAEYMALWEEKQRAAQEVAEKFYQDEMDALEGEFVDKIPEAISGLKDGLYDVGTSSAQGLAEGLKSMQSYVSQTAVSIIESALAAAEAAMGVHSPSTVWAGFGENLAAGVGVGFEEQMRNVSYNMQQALPRPEDAFGNLAAGMVNGINTAMTGAGNPQPLTVVMEVDSRQLARILVPDIRAVERSSPVVLSGV